MMRIVHPWALAAALVGTAIAQIGPKAAQSSPGDGSLTMPYIIRNPGPEYADAKRMFQGIPSIAVAPGGRLWATWYGGGEGEGKDNYVMLATSGDAGKTWSPPKLIVNPPFRASEPAVWLDPQNRLWFVFNLYPLRTSKRDTAYYQEKFGNADSFTGFIRQYSLAGMQLWAMVAEDPDAPDPAWSEPRLIAMEHFTMNKPTVLSTGAWLWPAGPLQRRQARVAVGPLFSEDQGKTFQHRGEVPIVEQFRDSDEYQVVERKDGSLWLLNRTKYGVGESFSFDGGKTWTELARSKIAHTVSRFFITRLKSGNLLLVKHGAIDQSIGRSRLMAFVSADDGKTWQGGLMLDERKDVTYPDGMQASDGQIYLIYDHGRSTEKEILLSVFTEADAMAGKPVSDQTRLRQIVNKASGVNPRAAAKQGEP